MASKKKPASRKATRRSTRTAEEKINDNLDTTIIAVPLLREIEAIAKKQGKTRAWRRRYYVIIDLNLLYPERQGVASARNKAIQLIEKAIETVDSDVSGCFYDNAKSDFASQHLFARMTGNQIKALRAACSASLIGPEARPIYKIWLDNEVKPLLTKSISTIKADAALVSYSATGDGLCWAVIDWGIDGTHMHFKEHGNLVLEKPLHHMDFTGDRPPKIAQSELPEDDNGHGPTLPASSPAVMTIRPPWSPGSGTSPAT